MMIYFGICAAVVVILLALIFLGLIGIDGTLSGLSNTVRQIDHREDFRQVNYALREFNDRIRLIASNSDLSGFYRLVEELKAGVGNLRYFLEAISRNTREQKIITSTAGVSDDLKQACEYLGRRNDVNFEKNGHMWRAVNQRIEVIAEGTALHYVLCDAWLALKDQEERLR